MFKRILCLFFIGLIVMFSSAKAEDIRTAVASLPDDALVALHAVVLEELMNRDIGHARKQQLQLEYSKYEEHIISGLDVLEKTVFYTENIGKETSLDSVWISENGIRYHTIPECCGMNNPIEVSVARAIIKGLTPCQDCAYWMIEAEN